MQYETFEFDWSEEKNEVLKRTRDISFEKIVQEIKKWNTIDVIPHHNQVKYPHQKIFAIWIDEYVYAVPFVQEWEKCFLKTTYKDRNLTAFYFGKTK